MKGLIMKMWDIYDALWSYRCGRVHDETDVEALTATDTNNKIKFYYDNKRRLFDSGDYDCFHMGLSHTLQLPLPQRKAWLANIIIRKKATEKARNKMTKQMKQITEFFPRIQADEDSQE